MVSGRDSYRRLTGVRLLSNGPSLSRARHEIVNTTSNHAHLSP